MILVSVAGNVGSKFGVMHVSAFTAQLIYCGRFPGVFLVDFKLHSNAVASCFVPT